MEKYLRIRQLLPCLRRRTPSPEGTVLHQEFHSNGDFGQIPGMACQRLRPYLPDDRVVLLLQGLANGDVMTGSTDGGTRKEPGTNVVFGKKNAEVTQLFENALSCYTGGRGDFYSRCRENWGSSGHIWLPPSIVLDAELRAFERRYLGGRVVPLQ